MSAFTRAPFTDTSFKPITLVNEYNSVSSS